MTQKKSIIKRIKVSKRNNARNKIYRTGVRNIIKKCLLTIQNSANVSRSDIDLQLSIAYSQIDKAVQKGIFHINNGARKKARLARALKTIA
uniref:ribosomal protein S20 n=1 Tax=Goniotrichopsis reniformis TaxID=468933 RepID=UPI001FCDCAB4|nr:ribosomal protein S20 [Goniotrichopsis reniformis]UNJ14845.1 ribosomal protein S20 [Goniotrichopsis reniformis]